MKRRRGIESRLGSANRPRRSAVRLRATPAQTATTFNEVASLDATSLAQGRRNEQRRRLLPNIEALESLTGCPLRLGRSGRTSQTRSAISCAPKHAVVSNVQDVLESQSGQALGRPRHRRMSLPKRLARQATPCVIGDKKATAPHERSVELEVRLCAIESMVHCCPRQLGSTGMPRMNRGSSGPPGAGCGKRPPFTPPPAVQDRAGEAGRPRV